MSGVQDTRCCDNILNGFIRSCPTISKSSKSISKIAMIYAAMSGTIAILVSAMMVVNNPNAIFFSQWHWAQMICFAVPAVTCLLSLITACFLSCVGSKVKENSMKNVQAK